MKKIFTFLAIICLGVAQSETPFEEDVTGGPIVILPIEEIVEVNPGNFDEVIGCGKPVVLDVYAKWCGPCRALAPVIEELNDEYGVSYRFAKLNIDEQADLGDAMEIRLLPTLIFFKDGVEVARHAGPISKDQLLDKIIDAFEKE